MKWVRVIRRIDKEFTRKMTSYIRTIKELDKEKNYIGVDYFRSPNTMNALYGLQSLGAEIQLAIDYEKLCLLGEVEVNFYHDGTFSLSKERVPFFINHQESLLRMLKIVYGTPFSLELSKIQTIEFVRYQITIPEIKTTSFSELLVFIRILGECFHQINESVIYD